MKMSGKTSNIAEKLKESFQMSLFMMGNGKMEILMGKEHLII